MAQQSKPKAEKKCRTVLSNKQRMVKSTHSWVVSVFDTRFSVCQDCGMCKKN